MVLRASVAKARPYTITVGWAARPTYVGVPENF